jgi:predicted peroxiredoxin
MNNNIFYNKYIEDIIADITANKTKHERGVYDALHAYEMTKKYVLEIFTAEETPFAQNMGDFMKVLDDAGITEFNLCERSSRLMATLHCLLDNGWTIVGKYEQEIERDNSLGIEHSFYGLCMKKQ